jgi:squalene-hopene/tetraprenyl-beta-curcumene cyclase
MSSSDPHSAVSTFTLSQHHLKVQVEPSLASKVDQAITRTQTYLRGLQKEDGHWIGELIVDTTLVCDIMLYEYWYGQVNVERQSRIVKHILDRQLPDGGWAIYHGGPSEINASVKCYFALKMAGFAPDDAVMKKAHATIIRLGGIPKMNTYGKLYLALVGQFPWKYLPVIPSEAILLPNWLFFNIYELSSWTRNMFVPLSVINHYRPTKLLPPEKQLHELYPYGTEGQDFSLPRDKKWISWRNFFLFCDRMLHVLEACPWKPFRALALRKSEEWMLARCGEGSDGIGAIFPSILNALIVFRCLGYPDDHPVVKKTEKHLYDFEVFDKEKDDYRFQPCFSPIWDTAITSVALASSGVPRNDPQLVKAADYLVSQEVRFKGDWAVKNPYKGEPSGWAFEYHNKYYPDVDDTVKVLLALRQIESTDEKAKLEAVQRALPWAASFQCKNGGYAAFDKDVTKKWLDHVPFADHKAILDPPCSDITARVLECFGRYGFNRKEKFLSRAIEYMRETQEEDGSWYGRWGVNYIYGTWQGLRGLYYIGEDMNQDWIVRARDWLESCQNPDGGWGETCASYDDSRLKGQGPSTPSQTAWALMGMLGFNDPARPSVQRAVQYLTTTQSEDGSWREDHITGTGFPCVFYLKYDLYRTNWPMIALSEFRQLLRARSAKVQPR